MTALLSPPPEDALGRGRRRSSPLSFSPSLVSLPSSAPFRFSFPLSSPVSPPSPSLFLARRRRRRPSSRRVLLLAFCASRMQTAVSAVGSAGAARSHMSLSAASLSMLVTVYRRFYHRRCGRFVGSSSRLRYCDTRSERSAGAFMVHSETRKKRKKSV